MPAVPQLHDGPHWQSAPQGQEGLEHPFTAAVVFVPQLQESPHLQLAPHGQEGLGQGLAAAMPHPQVDPQLQSGPHLQSGPQVQEGLVQALAEDIMRKVGSWLEYKFFRGVLELRFRPVPATPSPLLSPLLVLLQLSSIFLCFVPLRRHLSSL